MRRRGAVRGGPKGCVIAVALALFGLLAAPSAEATPRATIGVKPLLGWGGQHQRTLLVATACSGEALDDAILELDVSWNRNKQVQRERLDVPAHGCARVGLPAIATHELVATLLTRDGRRVARGGLEPPGAWRFGVVLDLSLKGIGNGAAGWGFTMIPPDIEVPPDAMDWSSVSFVVTRDRTLGDQPPNLRRAVEHWVSRGGVLVVASPEPAADERRGAGLVVTLPADETLPERMSRYGRSGRLAVEPGTNRELAYAYWERPDVREVLESVDPTLRGAPSAGLSWALLLGYVALLGPLSYRFLFRRGHPALAIGSVPASAACVMAALFGHGLAEQGSRPRSSALAFAEVLSGDRTAAVRRIAGFVTTRPGPLRIVSTRGAFVSLLPIGQRPVEWRTHGIGGAADRRTVLETRRVGLWDTVFASEGSFVDLGGTVEIRATEGGYHVENRTPHTLRNATISGYDGLHTEYLHWSLGTIPPGAVRVVRRARDPGSVADLGLPELFVRSVNLGFRMDGVSLFATLAEPLLPAFEGFERDDEPTSLRVVLR